MTRRKLFVGSYMDGLCNESDGDFVDLAEWAGLKLNDEQRDRFWDEYNITRLLGDCDSAEIFIDEQVEDHLPGMNDTYYSVYTNDPEGLKAELREVIRKTVQDA
jgi:hypothetical protein